MNHIVIKKQHKKKKIKEREKESGKLPPMRGNEDQTTQKGDTEPDPSNSQTEESNEVFAQNLLCFESLFFLLFLSLHS